MGNVSCYKKTPDKVIEGVIGTVVESVEFKQKPLPIRPDDEGGDNYMWCSMSLSDPLIINLQSQGWKIRGKGEQKVGYPDDFYCLCKAK